MTEMRWRGAKDRIGQFLKPKLIRDWTALLKEVGFWTFLKRKGWKVVIAIILFYLIRDSFLYLVIPYLVARGILGK